MELKRGTQVICVPSHARGDVNHRDCEAGFVTSGHSAGGIAFCRYWSKLHPGELRTRANSELTKVFRLVIRDSVPQEQVEAALEEYCGE